MDGIYSEQTLNPDLVVDFKMGNFKKNVAVECKWRSRIKNGYVQFSYDDQLKRYKDFENSQNIDVYIALGIGGEATKPQSLYLIPLNELEEPFIQTGQLKKYWKLVDAPFFLDVKTGKVKGLF